MLRLRPFRLADLTCLAGLRQARAPARQSTHASSRSRSKPATMSDQRRRRRPARRRDPAMTARDAGRCQVADRSVCAAREHDHDDAAGQPSRSRRCAMPDACRSSPNAPTVSAHRRIRAISADTTDSNIDHPVGAAERRLARALRVRHQADDVARLVADAGDVVDAIRSGWPRPSPRLPAVDVAEDHLPVRVRAPRCTSGSREVVAFAVRDGDPQHLPWRAERS